MAGVFFLGLNVGVFLIVHFLAEQFFIFLPPLVGFLDMVSPTASFAVSDL